ncbi:MAG: cob(I)yrinic acid a,c-diamide adenosyltransferase [Candidatus Woesearchaeota archaeon]
MAITTKIGDKGKTNILFGHQIDKTDFRLEVCGTVDELNAAIGIARATVQAPNLKQELLTLQHQLFVVGSEVATLQEDASKLKRMIGEEDLRHLEQEIGLLEKYNRIDNWFIPGESLSSAHLEKARTIARRLERHLLKLGHHNETTKIYLNRISDYLWLLSQKEEYYLRGIERESTEEHPSEQQTTI